MAQRIDFYDDSTAPRPNSLVLSVNVVVTNEADEILMIRRSDNDNWALPGGAIDLGESLPEAGIHETLEETGIRCKIIGLVGTYTDPRHIILYTSNGEARQVNRAGIGGATPQKAGNINPDDRLYRWNPCTDVQPGVMATCGADQCCR
ncbi:NUDIX hydrolase [Planobispora longispora]|uniref:Nudix hydrolase domain-containing protein n=1 Tax=Planobispora longispora TaxID=28887 RepID=A0A8J3RMG2_9ACTN|nr:NUDIX domain-containing protein [Planobispora longispora]BFE83822.1 hypothetical protein GCM10020093_064230 [Planobispora longispora]GIH78352.1 hypothetical protein Plo01_47810 [Planobispora longispora]